MFHDHREPEAEQAVDYINILRSADAHGSEPGIGDQLLDGGARTAVGSAKELVGGDAVDDWALDLLPSVRAEGSVVQGPGRGLRDSGCAVHVLASHVVGSIDHQLSVERAAKA